jgi:RHS repeat-associated protein
MFPPGTWWTINGNTISVSTTGVIDTLGSIAPTATILIKNYWQAFPTNAGTTFPPETYTYKDATGASQVVTIKYGVYSLDNLPAPSPCYTPGPGADAYAGLPQSITFPEKMEYTFTYELISGLATGRLSSVTLPTGGSVSWSYPPPSGGGKNNSCADNGAFALTRTTSNGTWTYTRTLSTYVGTAGLTTTTTAVAPTGETTVYTFMYYPQGGNNNYIYLETSKKVYAGAATGTPLLFQQTCYNGFAPPCASETYSNMPNAATGVISSTDDYLSYNGGGNSRTTTTYENPLYAPIEVDEYDFGATTPTRKTFTTYLSLNGVQTNKVATVVVKDGNNNIVQQSKNGYDETAVTPTSEIPQHVPVTGNRGNLTSSSVWRKSDGVWLQTTYTNDDTGDRLTAIDPCGNTACSDMAGTSHTTTYSYTDSPSGANPAGNSNAYATRVTHPNTGVAHVEYYQYDYNSGARTQILDQNGVVTNYAYDDPLDRKKLADSAVGKLNWATGGTAESMTAYNYPTATEVDLAQDQTATGDALLKTSTFYDGLGRAIKTVARDGSVVETAYDAFNRVCAVSNPTFNDPGALSCVAKNNKPGTGTDGITYFAYDPLGRKTLQTQPGGKTQTWKYNTNVVDFYDEDNSHWQDTSDGLGRLTKVLENDPAGSGSLTLETDYVYNTVDDLTSVNQKGASGDTPRVRTFVYDSMSQLTSACNPEATAGGAVCTPASGPWSEVYTYDANGNPATRTDARGVISHYTYDTENRLIAKRYTNDPANTPALAYGYDIEYPWQLTQDENNPIGHLNSIMATVGTTNLVTWTSGDYDQRGNLTGYVTCLGADAQSCPGSGVGANLGYDLDEKLTSITENAGGAVYNGQFDYIAYDYDSVGRLQSIATDLSIDNSGNSLTSTAFAGLTYYAGGGVKTANLAIDPTTLLPGISLSRTYDNRGRITGEVDTNSQKTNAYSYSVNYDGTGTVSSFNDSVAGTGTVTNDALHRLSSLTGMVSGGSATFKETYDHFGNRNVEYFTYKGVQNQPSPYLNFTAGNNRVDNDSYDNAGNLLADGTNRYLYDAENRLCAVQQDVSGRMVGYVYAPDGTRLGKGTITGSFSCDVTKNGILTESGLVLTNAYNVDPQGEQLEETDGNFNGLHFNVFWEGKVLGTFAGTTYSESNWRFSLNDWLGTKRQITNSNGTLSTSFSSGPFGDYQTQYGAGSDPDEHHFTNQDRDIESNLDYFPARYYNSNLGRFMTPDWSEEPDSVPHADYTKPQSLNLYSYVFNNPLTSTDADGHDCSDNTEIITARSADIDGGSYVHTSSGTPCSQSNTGVVTQITSSLQQASQIAQHLTQEALNYLNAPRDATCLAASAAQGAATGAAAGGAAGAAGGAGLGLATTGGAASLPLGVGGAAEGAGVGAQIGFTVGTGVGFFTCKTGGSGSGGGGRKWKWGNHKTSQKAANQMAKRGWTDAQIDEAVRNGAQYPAPNNINPANGATRYVNPTTGRSVVIDNLTQEVLHVGGDGFQY